ncbi:ADP-ribosylglycohydrolase family protein [Hahella sp. CR1]|uniref:ADP-ribosylglycohydrolase family protein n=1 Tax=Hahella sp. CR1 TaxID=2992807 RepID=UPI002441E426|nr:ADP-ribosylglycohydrolase family protein [Hahella sp. CR1]MDG9666541.1 ADP-ribosylglycohydrolase family protein [Hahella sp. CR1]
MTGQPDRNNLDKYQGCLLGLAVGDAVGTTLEFRPRGSFEPIDDMVGGGPFGLQPGQWTDDTSMALCLAESLLTKQGFNAADQMTRYCNWWQWGYFSSTGNCFDIGNTVRGALQRFLDSGEPYSGSLDAHSAGNGSIMRLAPVAMYYSPRIEQVVQYCGESSRTTHGADECIDACRLMGVILHQLLTGDAKEDVLEDPMYVPYTDKVAQISVGDYLNKSESEVRGTGYVIDALEAALWCFAHTDNFQDAVLKAANLGDDADTTAAIVGQFAGAYYGVNGIRQDWLDKLHMRDDIAAMAEQLYTAQPAKEPRA